MVGHTQAGSGKAKAYSWLLLAMIFWGSAFPSSEWAVRNVPHSVAAWLRFGGGAVVLLVAAVAMGRTATVTRRKILAASVAGIVGVFGYNTVFFWGVSMAPATDGSVLFPALTPVITTVVLVLTKRESAPARRVLGLTLGVGAAVAFFVATSSHLRGGSRHLLGDAIFVAGAAIWTGYTLLSRKVLAGMDAVWSTAIATVAGSIALGGLAVPDLGKVHWGALSTGFWINAAWLSIGPTAASYVLFSRGIRDVGAGTASTMMFTVPLFGTAFSYVFLGESFTAAQAAAAIVMLLGAFLAATASATRGPGSLQRRMHRGRHRLSQARPTTQLAHPAIVPQYVHAPEPRVPVSPAMIGDPNAPYGPTGATAWSPAAPGRDGR
jgi:drug/metabolite transporter (DMT)-like permease